MPNINDNERFWGHAYDWSSSGEEWSAAWGSSASQWYGCLLPRIRSFLPAKRVLEIAPGYGRWTQYLLPWTGQYDGVELSSECVAQCSKRFVGSDVRFHVNDGKSLEMIPDQSIDFVFSFDSLVHADSEALHTYIPQIIRKLTAKGAAFLHHSNLGRNGGCVGPTHWRDPSVSAEFIQTEVDAAEGQLLRQEIITWASTEHLDCISLLSKKNAYDIAPDVVVNTKFMDEARYIREYLAPWQFR